MTTASAIYLRISQDHTGEGLAVERQREDCEKIAAERGWTVVETYIDNSISASKRTVKRPAYERMVEDFKAGRFSALVVWDLDRLTRQPRQLEDWIDAAEGRGLLLTTANGEADLTTDSGRLFARIKASVARAEVERKSARQTRAAQQRAELGKPPAGVRLTGYTFSGEVIPEEAELVRRIFSDFKQGHTLKGIATALKEEGVETRRGTQWHSSTVRTILTNPRYAGRAVYQGRATGKLGAWDGLVSEIDFDLVQARLTDPRRKLNREGTERKHLGSGLFICGICMRPLRTNGPRYWCPEGGHVTRAMPPINEHVLATIAERLSASDVAGMLAPVEDDAVSALQEQLQALRGRLSNLESDYDRGYIDGLRYSSARGVVMAELKAIETASASLMAGHTVGGLITGENPAQAFLSAPLAIQRAVIDALMVVRILPAPRGVRGFDPSTVLTLWRRTRMGGTPTPVVAPKVATLLG